MATATTFNQIEVPVVLEPEFSTQRMGGYDSSQVYAQDFLDPHLIPSLPTSQPFGETRNSQHAPNVGPKSPSGATYEVRQLPQDIDYLFARGLIGPAYEHIFDSQDPEESSKKQMTELEMILGAAKDELKEAYHYAVKTRARYVAIRTKRKPKQSRWEEEETIPSNPKAVLQCSVPEGRAVGGKHVKKETKYNQFGGTLLTF